MKKHLVGLVIGTMISLAAAGETLPLVDTRQEVTRCGTCSSLGISESDGVVFLWAVFNQNPEQLVVFDSNGGLVSFGQSLVDFLDTDGTFAAVSFLGKSFVWTTPILMRFLRRRM